MTLQQRSKGRVLLNYWYNESTSEEREAGKVWYNEAREYVKILSLRFDTPQIICAGVVSALSPNNRWERNKIDAHAVKASPLIRLRYVLIIITSAKPLLLPMGT